LATLWEVLFTQEVALHADKFVNEQHHGDEVDCHDEAISSTCARTLGISYLRRREAVWDLGAISTFLAEAPPWPPRAGVAAVFCIWPQSLLNGIWPQSYESWPQSLMTTGLEVVPDCEPTASIFLTTSMVSAVTLPKTTCLPSSQSVLTVHRKN